MAARRLVIGLGTVAALLALWFILTTATGIVGPARFPSPAEFWASLNQINGRGYAGSTLAGHALHSLRLVRSASSWPSSRACRSGSGWAGTGAWRRWSIPSS